MKTSQVENIQTYWSSPPPAMSPRCREWIDCIEGGWKPNRRIRSLGYYESAEFFGIYIWEYINVIFPAINGE